MSSAMMAAVVPMNTNMRAVVPSLTPEEVLRAARMYWPEVNEGTKIVFISCDRVQIPVLKDIEASEYWGQRTYTFHRLGKVAAFWRWIGGLFNHDDWYKRGLLIETVLCPLLEMEDINLKEPLIGGQKVKIGYSLRGDMLAVKM